MPNVMMWSAYARTLLLSFRVIVFEKTTAVATVLWAALALLAMLVMLMYSLNAAVVTAVLMVGVLPLFRRWAQVWRYRLVRTADRIEFADMSAEDDGYVQRFASGVVLRRLSQEDVKRSGGVDAKWWEDERWFYLVRTPQKTTIVALGWIVAIEIDEE